MSETKNGSVSIAVGVKTDRSRLIPLRPVLDFRSSCSPTREASAVIDGVIYRITRYTYARPPLFVRKGYYPAITRREMEIMSFRFDGTSTVCRVTSCVTFAYAEFMHGTIRYRVIPRCISKEKISVGVYIYIGCVDPRDPIP